MVLVWRLCCWHVRQRQEFVRGVRDTFGFRGPTAVLEAAFNELDDDRKRWQRSSTSSPSAFGLSRVESS